MTNLDIPERSYSIAPQTLAEQTGGSIWVTELATTIGGQQDFGGSGTGFTVGVSDTNAAGADNATAILE